MSINANTMHITLLRLLVPLALLLNSGCQHVEYYQQLGLGQWQLLNARQPVSELLEDPSTSEALTQRLQASQLARDFASQQLYLPDNASYRVYADLKRPFVVWNVFATPELSLAPELYCFPIAGCVAYRGYYQPGRARGAAALLAEQGLDTYIAGIEAYSTLGWFADPLLNSMLRWNDERVAAVIFHELAHQQYYLPGDTAFNESFATFVEQQGLQQWQQAQGQTPSSKQDQQRQQFIELVLACRQRLAAVYASELPDSAKREAKQAEFERLRRDYVQWRDTQWHGNTRFDQWINSPLNNAKLLPFGLYDQWVPAFAALFAANQQHWPSFYLAVAKLGALNPVERQQQLQHLQTVHPSLAQ